MLTRHGPGKADPSGKRGIKAVLVICHPQDLTVGAMGAFMVICNERIRAGLRTHPLRTLLNVRVVDSDVLTKSLVQ